MIIYKLSEMTCQVFHFSYIISFRTAEDIQVLDHCEIPPIRTEFIEPLGQGAFGKVHKAKLKDGLKYFAIEQDLANTPKRRQKIVAVKELHGECAVH